MAGLFLVLQLWVVSYFVRAVTCLLNALTLIFLMLPEDLAAILKISRTVVCLRASLTFSLLCSLQSLMPLLHLVCARRLICNFLPLGTPGTRSILFNFSADLGILRALISNPICPTELRYSELPSLPDVFPSLLLLFLDSPQICCPEPCPL
jgi:hypothetical protein